jgi:hypothetical protein
MTDLQSLAQVIKRRLGITSGEAVATTQTQTLTNKTLTSAVLNGNTTINIQNDTPLQLSKASWAGTAEILQEWRVADDLQSFFRIQNASDANGAFAPTFWGGYAQGSNFPGTSYWVGGVDSTSSVPVLVFNIYDIGDNGTVVNRPLFEIQNDGAPIVGANSSGFYLFNPAGTFKYVVIPSALAADRNLSSSQRQYNIISRSYRMAFRCR